MIHEYFPLEYQMLNRELGTGLHPRLEKILAANGGTADDIDLKVAQIAAYCGVQLDGVYTLEDRIGLCRYLLELLPALRENPNKDIVHIN